MINQTINTGKKLIKNPKVLAAGMASMCFGNRILKKNDQLKIQKQLEKQKCYGPRPRSESEMDEILKKQEENKISTKPDRLERFFKRGAGMSSTQIKFQEALENKYYSRRENNITNEVTREHSHNNMSPPITPLMYDNGARRNSSCHSLSTNKPQSGGIKYENLNKKI